MRQNAYASAFATYAPNGFGVFANLPTYQPDIVAADNAFKTAVSSAAMTNAITPFAVDPMLQAYPSFSFTILTWANP